MFSVLRKSFISSIFNRKSYFLYTALESNYELFSKWIIAVHNLRFKYTFKPMSLREGPQPSRYHPGSVIELAEEHIESILDSKTTMDDEEWDNFKADVITDVEIITEENFTSIVMNCLLSANKLELAHNFMKYLENCSLKPNFLTYLKYISLCSRYSKKVDQELILKTFHKIKFALDNRAVLDMKTAEYTIQGLCATDKWRDSFEYMEKLTNKPSLAIYSTIACAAIRNGDESLAWDILTKWIKYGEIPGDRVIEEFLLVALEKQKINPCKTDKFLKEVFQYMQAQELIVGIDVVKIIEQYFKRHQSKWNISYTKVNRKGDCEKCGHSLKLLDLTNEEFNHLKKCFLERVVKKSDIFINSTSEEFNKYIDFIERYKPFHIVIDGLNAAHTYPYRKSPKNLALQLLKITKILAGKSKKVLVLGRRHMKNWPSFAMRRISEKSSLFFTDNISQDDPFVIYAALASGPHTLYLSCDLMRDHISRLDDSNTIKLFKRWQQSHQIFVTDTEKNLKFIEPLRHSINTQGQMDRGWHIPFDDKIILDPYEELNNWLCIEKDYNR